MLSFNRLSRASGVLLLLVGVACESGGPTCAEGTTRNADGACVADPSDEVECGAGTELVDGECVAPVGCGPDEVEVDGGCQPGETPPACGEGTIEVDGICVPAPNDGGVVDGGPQEPLCVPACGSGEYCNTSAVCVPTPRPASWVCSFEAYRDGETCDCACGAYDPDCDDASLPVANCFSGSCESDGSCTACVPQCDGKECGDDGCGGDCGYCSLPGQNFCNAAGTCEACTADCTDKICGDDGCGGSCGTCAAGTACELGLCQQPEAGASCEGRCGDVAPDGCSCEANCHEFGTCCVDVNVCGCQPNCLGKECGPDGCGGFCGGCLAEDLCTEDQLCVDNPCDPNPCTAFGTCNEADGSCACATGYAGATCGECAPDYAGYPNCEFQ